MREHNHLLIEDLMELGKKTSSVILSPQYLGNLVPAEAGFQRAGDPEHSRFPLLELVCMCIPGCLDRP